MSELVRTGAGTLRSMASFTVQRPIPESCTIGAMSLSSGPSASKARWTSSRSHDRMTLPCCHTREIRVTSRSKPGLALRMAKPSA